MKKYIALILVLTIILSAFTLSGCSENSNTVTLYEFKDNYEEGTPITKGMVKPVKVNISEGFVGGNGSVYTAEALAKLTLITKDNWKTFVTEGAVLRNSVTKGSLFLVDQSVVWCKYDDVYKLYMDSRKLYEEILDLDIQTEQNAENVVSKDYKAFLDSINTIYSRSVKLEAPSEYKQIHLMINTFLSYDIAIYCQRIASAIDQNSGSEMQEAEKCRIMAYNDFMVITQTLIETGEAESQNVLSIKNWSYGKGENWWLNNDESVDSDGVLDPEIPLNYIPVPGSIELYMVIDDDGNIVKYRERKQQEDGSWVWKDVNPDITADYEPVPGLDNVYKVTNKDGTVSYYKYIRNDNDTFAFIPVDENGIVNKY